MKKVILILKGRIAKIFLSNVVENYFSNNYYCVIYSDKDMYLKDLPTTFKLFNFDATSPSKLSEVIDGLSDIFLIHDDAKETKHIYLNIRKLTKNSRVTMFDFDLEKEEEGYKRIIQEDKNLFVIDPHMITANKLLEKIPNTPLVPQGFGLGEGEVMEIGVPFGSSYAYMSLSGIRQEGWRIVGLYRNGKLMIPVDDMTIQPNDNILVIGDPKILNNVYKRVKSNTGNFPAPYGVDIYIYLDLNFSDEAMAMKIIDDVLWLHKRIKNNKLIVNIINPRNIKLLEKLKALYGNDVYIHIDYFTKNLANKIAIDSSKKAGLIVLDPLHLEDVEVKKELFINASPILKVGKDVRLKECSKSLLILSESSSHLQSISYPLVDVASQLKLEIKLYEFEADEEYNEPTYLYFQNIGKIFNKNIEIERTNSKNPILWLFSTEEKHIHFLPFEMESIKSNKLWFLKKEVERMSLKVNSNPQILIPFE